MSGHVHTQATICEQTDTENNRTVVFELDPKWSKYILPKGFVAVDGCSLTVGPDSWRAVPSLFAHSAPVDRCCRRPARVP